MLVSLILGANFGALAFIGWHVLRVRALIREIGEMIMMGVIIDPEISGGSDR